MWPTPFDPFYVLNTGSGVEEKDTLGDHRYIDPVSKHCLDAQTDDNIASPLRRSRDI